MGVVSSRQGSDEVEEVYSYYVDGKDEVESDQRGEAGENEAIEGEAPIRESQERESASNRLVNQFFA